MESNYAVSTDTEEWRTKKGNLNVTYSSSQPGGVLFILVDENQKETAKFMLRPKDFQKLFRQVSSILSYTRHEQDD